MVRAPHLPGWLGLPVDAPPEELHEALKARRRQLQSMLANPKRQREASFVVRNIGSLDTAIDQIEAHIEDMARRAEAKHIPALELMIEGLLSTGHVDPVRYEQLLDRVLALGVREQTFRGLYERLSMRRAPITRASSAPSGDVTLYERLGLRAEASAEEIRQAISGRLSAITGDSPEADAERTRILIADAVLQNPGARRLYDARNGLAREVEPPDLYRLIGLRRGATPAEIDTAYERRLAALGPDDRVEIERLEIARMVLTNPAARRRYDNEAVSPSRKRSFELDPEPLVVRDAVEIDTLAAAPRSNLLWVGVALGGAIAGVVALAGLLGLIAAASLR